MDSKYALLVDAFNQTGDCICKILNDAGYKVKVALNEKEGLFKLYNKKNFFDLVIANVNIPDSQSINFIKMTRNEARHKNIPIIAITSEFTESCIDACIEAGATDLLKNPFESADFKKVIKLLTPP